MALKLQAAGIDSFVVLERADDVGGTWRDNDYPGCACDIPSHLYSFSFERSAEWTHDYPSRAEILAYLREVTRKHDLRPHIRFGVDVSRALFDETTATWQIDASDGRSFRARSFVSAIGGLSRPYVPELPGLATFGGRVFHSAEWDPGYDLARRRIAVVGTGASAIQFVPRIAPDVEHLAIFQRTPPWILPKPGGEIGPGKRGLLRRLPWLGWLNRKLLYWLHEARALGFTLQPKILQFLEKSAVAYLHAQIADAALRAKLTPDYRMGCKRILLSNDYYAALRRTNVELVTSAVAGFERGALVTADGTKHPVDAVILGTGFRASDPTLSMRVFGRDGIELADVWKNGAEAYLGISVAGFPNFYMLVGPNTGLGHNSMVYMIEAQVRYVTRAIRLLRRRKARAFDVRPRVQATFNRRLQRRMARTVWTSGCRSWYLDAHGKNTTLWPGFSFVYGLRTRRFRLRRYRAS